VEQNGKWFVDTDAPSWKRYLSERELQAGKVETRGRKPKVDKYAGDLEELVFESKKASLNEQIHKSKLAEYKVEKERLAIEKEVGELIDYQLADFLFFGFMDKMANELLRLPKKLEPQIVNLAKEKEYNGIIKLLTREHENVLKDIKTQQLADLKEWRHG